MTVREVVYDAEGKIVREPRTEGRRRRAATVETPLDASATKPGQTRKEVEGVFVVRDGRAEFVPVKTGIAGEKYFEVLSGLKPADEVITGPFASVRSLREGDEVKVTTAPALPVK
jgi:HlyD family secretion protein